MDKQRAVDKSVFNCVCFYRRVPNPDCNEDVRVSQATVHHSEKFINMQVGVIKEGERGNAFNCELAADVAHPGRGSSWTWAINLDDALCLLSEQMKEKPGRSRV